MLQIVNLQLIQVLQIDVLNVFKILLYLTKNDKICATSI